MNDLKLLIWLTQLGLSVAAPPLGFLLSALWLRERFDLGGWVIWLGIGLGVFFAIDGFRASLKAMEQMEHNGNDHQ